MNTSAIIEVASGVLLLAGGLFVISGGLGLLRFPDFYTRIHAVALTDSVGATLILLALLVRVPDWEAAVRVVLILGFMLLTGPTATQALAQAARRDGVRIWREGDERS